MPYSEDLDTMVRAITEKDGMLRKKMFGGTCYLLDGKMVCGVWKDFLILKLGEAEAAGVLENGSAQAFDITGKPMKRWVMVGGAGLTVKAAEAWIEKAKSYVKTVRK